MSDDGLFGLRQRLMTLFAPAQVPADNYTSGIYAGDYNPLGKLASAMGNVASVAQVLPVNMAKSAYSGATAPGDAWAGNIAPDQMLPRAMDTAGLVTLGAGAAPAEANSLRMGVGLPEKEFRPMDIAVPRSDAAVVSPPPPPPGITAYHGSPYDFNQFSTNHIGTGEGAQAYGHGLYFADNEAVAKEYRDALSRQVTFQGAPVGTHPMDNALEGAKHSVISLVSDGVSPQDAIAQVSAKWRADAQPYIEFGKQNPEHAAMAAEHAKSFTDIADAASALNPADFVKNPGHMYEVNINADPSQMLDWDKPLKEQQTLIPKLQAAGLDVSDTSIKPSFYGLNDPATAEKLQQAGIPGIKYLDGGSRVSPLELMNAQSDLRLWNAHIGEHGYSSGWTQEGHDYVRQKAAELETKAANQSHNYVVFNDALVNIVKKYGIAGAVSAGLMTAQQAAQMQRQNFQQAYNSGNAT